MVIVELRFSSHAPVGAWLRIVNNVKLQISIDLHHGRCVSDAPNGASQRLRMKFYYVYVLKSLTKDFVYVGYTHDLRRRLDEHNSGKEFSTKPYIPFELIHYEAYRNEKDAKRREEYFKTTKGRTTLQTMLKEFFSK